MSDDSDDIVVQLGLHEMGLGPGTCQDCYSSTMDRAADEIKHLRSKIAKLQMALEPFALLRIHPDAPDDGLVIITNTSGGIIDTGKNRVRVGDIRLANEAIRM